VINVLRRSLRRRDGRRDGGAIATEFALLMAFLPLPIFVFGIVDYGEIMGQTANLSAIVRGAAEYARGAVVEGGISALPTGSAIASQLNTGATLTTASFCTCADGTSVSCTGTCSVSGDTRVLKYVAVSGSQTYTPLVSGTWSFPGSVQARAVLRTQ
jgi:Flp pilus assembly protein TadG